eukprot:comp17108_c0_seq1/m.15876 comp17108_c0_seq1/g.15876  ORF comp17108_c0_seq1/g.15876 comp17108_c0_seq1/m.15876 type:complete len:255 (-) comp17108_c0_seq1:793-1557(-)
MAEYESVICVKPEVFVYQIPPRTTNRGYRAADWNLNQWMWSGRLRIMAQGKNVSVRFEDKNSGELFAQSKLTEFPSEAVEPVTDSSRYFVLRIQDDTGRTAFVGLGFQERGDSFDFNAALQDHFRWLKEEEKMRIEASKPQNTGPSKDYSMKEGQTIKINFGKKTQTGGSAPSGSNDSDFSGISPLLPPPPSGGSRRGRSASPSSQAVPQQTQGSVLGDFDSFGSFAAPPKQQQQQQNNWDSWGSSGNQGGSLI